MFRSKRGHCFLAVAAGLSAAGTQARALDASDVLVYSLGPLHVRPHLTVMEQYNDNIFYRPSKPTPGFPFLPIEDDFITIISPGVSLNLGRRDAHANHIFLDYTLEDSLYATHNDQNHLDHTVSLNTYLAGSHVSLDGNDRVQFLSGILGGSSNLGQKVDRFVFSDNYRLEYNFSDKTSVYADGAFDATDYKRGTPLYDQNTLRGTGGFAFKPSSKTSLFGELYYGQSATSPNQPSLPSSPHADFFGGFIGARGNFTTRLSGSVKAGYESRQYSDGTPASSSPVVEVSLDEKFSDKTTASLTYSRRNSLSVQVAREAYTADAVTAQFNQVLTPNGKLVGVVTGSFENDDYEKIGISAARHDMFYHAGFALNYNFQRWLSAGLNYEFEKYVSNQVIDYDVNRVTLRISVGY